ncbi:hypothetical protein [Piscinibacter sp.]|uniref:hypothetical protein n=1 Tax=Piscinibacter sp. TaxID=1903157 RepID=UPI002BEED307|nr:hypothetical protein [Albitalea sp.]HUG23573.1 hypothetical protein [Albitalea sp.]
MTEATQRIANTLFIEVTGSGLPEVDGLYVPSEAPLFPTPTATSPGAFPGWFDH